MKPRRRAESKFTASERRIGASPGLEHSVPTVETLEQRLLLSTGNELGSLNAGVGGMTADLRIDYTAYDVVWEITGHNQGRRIDSQGSVDFQNLQDIDGTPQKELFIVLPGGSLDGYIDGEGGADALVYGWDDADFGDDVEVAFYSASEATATNIGGYVGNVETFIAGTSTDNEFAGPDLATDWVITGPGQGHVGASPVVNFVDFQNLLGGAADDSVTFLDNATLTSLEGGEGTNSLDLSAYTSEVVIDLAGSTMTPIGFFTGFEQITGSAASDTVIGENDNIDWFIYGNNRMYYDSGIEVHGGVASATGYVIDFRGIENILGGTEVNGFYFDDDAGIDGSLYGGGQYNTVSWQNYTGEVVVDLQDGTATGIGTTWDDIDSFIGGQGVDTLTARDATPNMWEIQSDDAGDINGGETTFASFGNLTGGDDNDSFVFTDGAGVSGRIDGAGGSNMLDWTDYTTGVTVNLAGQSATVAGGFTNIDQLQGSDGSDELIGPDATATWTMLDVDAGEVSTADATVTFTNFENLTGGDHADTFVLLPDTGISGTLTGGDGHDIVDYSDRDTAISFNLAAGMATDVGSFAGIEELVGSTDTADQLTGDDTPNTWNLTADYAGDINGEMFRFSGIEQIVGGADDDHFNVGPAVTDMGTIDGGDGNDLLSFATRNDGMSIELTGTNAGTVDGLGSFAQVENLTGTQGDSWITFDDGATLDGIIDGQGGWDSFHYCEYTDAVFVNLAINQATGVGGFLNVEWFEGSQVDGSTVIGPNEGGAWTIDDQDSMEVDGVICQEFGNILAGDGDDTFTFLYNDCLEPSTLSGLLDGGGGENVVDISEIEGPETVNLIDGTLGSHTVDGFTNITSFKANPSQDNAFVGTDDDNLWNITDDNAGTVNGVSFTGFGTLIGGVGADRFVFADGKVISGTLDGGDGLDRIDLTAWTTLNTWTPTDDGMEISTDFGTFSYQSIESFSGSNSVVLFTHADLTATWGNYSLPQAIARGDRFVLPVQVQNLSNVLLNNSVDITLYASADTTLDDDDITLGSLTQQISLAQNQQVVYNVSATFPVGMDFGTYYLIAKVDALDTIDETNEDNNIAVSQDAQSILPIFGRPAGRLANVTLSMPSGDGYQVYTITGPGWGRINEDGTLEIFNTTAQSQVRVATTGEVDSPTLPGITVHGTVGSFLAPGIAETGDVIIEGGVGTLTLGDVSPDAQRNIVIGQSIINGAITLGDVTDVDLTTQSPVSQLHVASWIDSDDAPDTVKTGAILRLVVDGDMGASVNASSAGQLTIRGDLVDGAAIVIAGKLVSASIGGDLAGLLQIGQTTTRLTIAGDLSGQVSVSGNLSQASVGGLSGYLEVGGGLTTLVVNGDLSGEVAVSCDLKSVRVIGGDMTGRLHTLQTLGTLLVSYAGGFGGAMTGTVEAGNRIGQLTTTAASEGLIQSPQIAKMVLGGGFVGTIKAVSTPDMPALKQGRYGLGAVSITNGDLSGSIEADTISSLGVSGDMTVDLVVNGDLASKPSVGTLKVNGNAEGLWQLHGDVGTVSILGQAHGLDLLVSGSVTKFTANSARDLVVSAGLADDALDDNTVQTAEVTNASAMLKSIRIGPAKLTTFVTASRNVTLAAPNMGSILTMQVNDLGTADGSALWLNSALSIHSLINKNTVAAKGFSYTGKRATWPAQYEPMQYIV